jgi:hypothetical protein
VVWVYVGDHAGVIEAGLLRGFLFLEQPGFELKSKFLSRFPLEIPISKL